MDEQAELNTSIWVDMRDGKVTTIPIFHSPCVEPVGISAIDHPNHYNWFDIECIDVIENFNYNLGAAIKHLWRAGRKNDIIEDLQKAAWYIQREIERLSGEQ